GGGAERVGDPDLIVEDVNGPRRVAGGQVGIGEGARERGGLEGLVVDLNLVGGAEVGREDVAGGGVGVEDGEAGIGGPGRAVVDGDERDGEVHAERRIPSGDGAVE